MCSLVETTATETAQLGLEKAVALVVRRAGAGGISWDAIVALLDQAHYGWGAQIRTVHSKENNVRSILSKATTKRQLRHIGPRTYAAVL
jgi:molybdopterin biosynthesis enzyme MoaB